MDYTLSNLVSLRPEAENLIGKVVKTQFGSGRIKSFQILVYVEPMVEKLGPTPKYFELHKVELAVPE